MGGGGGGGMAAFTYPVMRNGFILKVIMNQTGLMRLTVAAAQRNVEHGLFLMVYFYFTTFFTFFFFFVLFIDIDKIIFFGTLTFWAI